MQIMREQLFANPSPARGEGLNLGSLLPLWEKDRMRGNKSRRGRRLYVVFVLIT